MYAQNIEGDSWVGEKLEPGKIEKMSGTYPFKPRYLLSPDPCHEDQQIGQLYELMRAIRRKGEEEPET